MHHILVVEDEEPIANILKFALERAEYKVTCAYDGHEALTMWRAHEPDLILLDVMLPGIDGFDVLRTVRSASVVPVIMLTAKDDEVDKVLGLELGADDYVTKPFSTRELLARVKANLRRIDLDEGADDRRRDKYVIRDLVIDLTQYEVTKAGTPVTLTHREFQLLAFLAARPGQVYTREQLVTEVWGMDYEGDERAVDVTIRRLREKLESDPSQPEYVMTRRGVGYYVRAL
ncbi:response regulator [Alicyclobacillus dauci]|uniref:Response regulator transcription factor n=1 Tax=Alicyclobacillus dauci TaxID=1475485 RepID=A0ABY6Z249_9BACL|nr:response regulator [Alicyclobacillus dauci]WAH36983.1 response regulator transcription factor [Alicyclobacillus dauci]